MFFLRLLRTDAMPFSAEAFEVYSLLVRIVHALPALYKPELIILLSSNQPAIMTLIEIVSKQHLCYLVLHQSMSDFLRACQAEIMSVC